MARFRSSAIALAIALLVASAAAASEEVPPSRPSVLLVTLDTTRADHLGCYGADFAATPHLDALARQGVRFDDALSPAPLTLPSHASLLTGLVPRRHGVRDNALFRLGPEPELLTGRLREHGYRTAAFVSSVVLDRITGLDRGFEIYDDTVRIGPREAFDYRERAAVQTNDAALARLDEIEPPFFLWVHYFDPHLPYVPPAPFRARFAERPYDGEIAFMDEQLGRLLGEVRKKAPSLVVVVAGDHGESLGEHGEEAHGVFVYQATQRVPLIVAGPGLPRGKTVAQRVGLVDVAPTVLDLLGLPALPGVDGLSLVPLMRGESATPRDYEVESLYPYHAYGWAALHGLLRGEYKYILAPRRELYRLSNDPAERNNLIGKRSGRASTLERDLRALLAEDRESRAAPDPGLAEHRRRLESLGYVAGGGTAEGEDPIDPKQGVMWVADLEAGRRAYQSGRPAEGIAPLRRLLSRNPENVPALLALAMCYLGSGQANRAVETGRRATELSPSDDLAHFILANALAARGRRNDDAHGEAVAQYERALELNPRFADAYLNYASLLQRDGAEPRARSLLERARTAGVRDPDLETRIAAIELKRGHVEEAKAALRSALELHPRAPGALEAMARIAERQGGSAEAVEYYERLLEVTPGDSERQALRRRIEELSRAE